MKVFLLLVACLLLSAVILLIRPLLHSSFSSLKKISLAVIFSVTCMVTALLLYLLLGGLGQVRYSEQMQAAIQLRAQLGSVEQVIVRLKQQLAKKPDAKGWYLLGKLYLSEGRQKEAKAAFKEALRYDPSNPNYVKLSE